MPDETETIDLRSATGDELNAALQGAVQEAIRRHGEAGRRVVVARDGRTVLVKPGDIDKEIDSPVQPRP